jgi:hypothetical protein
MVAQDPPDQEMDAERAQEKRQQPDDVVSQHRIPSDRIDGQREQTDAKEMLGQSKGIPFRMKHVRVEQGRDPVEDDVVVPSEDPDDQSRIAAETRRMQMAKIDQGREHDARGEQVEREDGDPGRLPATKRHAGPCCANDRGSTLYRVAGASLTAT